MHNCLDTQCALGISWGDIDFCLSEVEGRMNHRSQTQMCNKYQISSFPPSSLISTRTMPSHRTGRDCNLTDSQSSPIPTLEGLPLALRCWEGPHPPVLPSDSPACTSCESSEHTGCHGDTSSQSTGPYRFGAATPTSCMESEGAR